MDLMQSSCLLGMIVRLSLQARSAMDAGGKAFALERLLAIFEAIVPDKLEYASQSIHVQTQVSLQVFLRVPRTGDDIDRLHMVDIHR